MTKQTTNLGLAATLLLALHTLPVLAAPITRTELYQNGVGGVNFYNGGVIPDMDYNGFHDTRTVSGHLATIVNVTVSLHLAPASGDYAWNGDYYAFLVHDDGFAVLLNRPGVASATDAGYGEGVQSGNGGMNIQISDTGLSGDIHNYQTVADWANLIHSGSATFQPDGRETAAGLLGDARTALLSSFAGLNPNGDWTLFMADLSGGGVGQLVSWGLSIQEVPEPGTWALAVFVVGLGTTVWWRQRRRQPAHPRSGL